MWMMLNRIVVFNSLLILVFPQAALSSSRLLLRLPLLQRRLCIRQLLRRSSLVLLNKVLQLLDGRPDSIPQRLEHGLCLLDNHLLQPQSPSLAPPFVKKKHRICGPTYVLLQNKHRIALLVFLPALDLFLLSLELGLLLLELLVVRRFFFQEAVDGTGCDD